MGLLGKATDKVQYDLTPVGEYVWTLWDMTAETGQYGEQVKWVWLISPVSDPDHYIERNNGSEQEIWQFTKPSIAKGTRARAWVEALLGRELKTGEDPDDSDLIRKRMVALLVHKPNKNDPSIKREAISEEIPPRAYRPTPAASRPSAPAAASNDDVESQLAARDDLEKKVKRLIRNAVLDDITYLEDGTPIEDIDVTNLAEADLKKLEADLKNELRKVAA